MITDKPLAADLDYLRTAESRRRTIPKLKRLYELMQQPNMVSLAGGTPNASIFPFDGVGTYTLSVPFSKGIAAPKTKENGRIDFRVFEAGDSAEAVADPSKLAHVDDIELASSLQYGAATGDDRLRNFVKEHVARVHDVGIADWDVMMSIGNTYAWDAVLRAFCEPTDTILLEAFTFPSALENAQTRGCRTIGVEIDEYGIVPEDLRLKAKVYKPKLLYTVPTGQNPTGSILTLERRKQVMEIAREYDFIVLEDEPYYYLQMENPADQSQNSSLTPEAKRTKFLTSLVPSMLEFDTDGRVVRLDSFSKVMAPGIRLSWITAQSRFIEAIRQVAETSSSKPSGFAQTLVYGVLARWGQNGFIDWLIGLRQEYTERRDICCSVLERSLTQKNIQFVSPEAGMFFWIKIRLPQQATLSEYGEFVLQRKTAREVEEEIFEYMATEYNVLAVPGHWCQVNPDPHVDHYIYFRGTFASETKEAVVDGAHRLADALTEYFSGHPVEPFSVIEKDDACHD